MKIGNKDKFAFDIAENMEGGLRVVDIIIANRSICCDDNSVYVPQYIESLNTTLEELSKNDYTKHSICLENKSYEEIHRFIESTRDEDSNNYNIENDELYYIYRFMDWGPTTDNISSFLFPFNEKWVLTYEFWRKEHKNKEEIEVVNSIEVNTEELISTIREAIRELEK